MKHCAPKRRCDGKQISRGVLQRSKSEKMAIVGDHTGLRLRGSDVSLHSGRLGVETMVDRCDSSPNILDTYRTSGKC